MTPVQRERWLLKPLIFVLALVPLAALALAAARGELGANPIETVTHETGQWALRLLLATLALTPLRNLTGWGFPVRVRRMVGLFAYFYATLHLATYVGLDQFFAWADIGRDILKRPYVTVGFLGFCLLTPLAATSTNRMMRRLGGRRWKRLHRLVYPAAAAGVVHFLWLVKADLREPLVYLAVLLGLLAFRAPGLPAALARLRAGTRVSRGSPCG